MAMIPLAFPQRCDAVFVVGDDGAVQEVAPYDCDHDLNALDDQIHAASCSTFDKDDTVMTTCAVSKRRIAVSCLRKNLAPIVVHLDLMTCSLFGEVIYIRCLAADSSFRLVMVDSHGVVLSMNMETSSLHPSSVKFTDISKLLQSNVTKPDIRSTMLTLTSSNVLLLSVTPHFISIDLTTEQFHVWSYSQTVKTARSSLYNITDYLLGPIDVVDMSPVSAVCNYKEHVVTLHSDGSVRLWVQQSIKPASVRQLDVALPEPGNWTDTIHSTFLTARQYRNVVAIAIFIQLYETSRLFVVDVDIGSGAHSSIELNVPNGTLVDLEFVEDQRCQIAAVVSSDNNTTVIARYPPSYVAIVSREPILQQVEKNKERVSFLDQVDNDDVQKLDALYLQHVFARARDPNVYGSIFPSNHCVRKALYNLGFRSATATRLELAVLQFVRQGEQSAQERDETWQALLDKIAELEQFQSHILCLSNGIVVRPNCIGILHDEPPPTSAVDQASLRVVEYLEQDRVLRDVEKLVDTTAHDVVGIRQLLISNLDFPPELLGNVRDLERSIGKERDFPLPFDTDSMEETPSSVLLNIQNRLAAANIAIQYAYFARRLFLGRFLVLRYLRRNDDSTFALRMYLHSAGILHVVVQRVPALLTDEPPRKRSKLSSLTSDKTIALDKLLVDLASSPSSSDNFLASAATGLGRAVLSAFFNFGASEAELPELQMLLVHKSAEIDNPRLAMRLLAPHVALRMDDEPRDVVLLRDKVMAECLIKVARTEPTEVSKQLLDRAFQLLDFDEEDLESSMKRLQTLQIRIGKNNTIGGSGLLKYIDGAIDKVESIGLQNSESYEILWSARFNTAISFQSWSDAYESCCSHPNQGRRVAYFRRLVTAFVDAGAVPALVEKCMSLARDADVFEEAIDFYEIAAETLAENGMRDLYTSLALDPLPPPDYLEALFCLHVAHKNWRWAAQAMDQRYLRALDALERPAMELTREQQAMRERVIVDDLVASAVACHQATTMVSGESVRHIVSGQSRNLAAVPFPVCDQLDDPKPNIHVEIFMDLDALGVRAARAWSLQTLFMDESCDPTFAKTAFINPNEITDSEIFDQLCAAARYDAAISLAIVVSKASKGSKLGGSDALHEFMAQLACNYLVPLIMNTTDPPSRPTIGMLQAANDCFKTDGDAPTSLLGRRSKKATTLVAAEVRAGAMVLLKGLTMSFSGVERPIATDVAKTMLAHRAQPLPIWLEDLLLFGTVAVDVPGVFARRRTPGLEGYLGDSAALLQAYIMNGLYVDACRVVKKVFAGFTGKYREEAATSRLPEKGEMDFVPWNQLDLLYNLIDIAMEKANGARLQMLQRAQSELKDCVEKYLSLLQVSAQGQASARVLAQKGN